LIPIRLDLDIEGIKMRDTFTWNLNEQLLHPQTFAELLCEDLHLPAQLFVPAIEKSMSEQIEDFYQVGGGGVGGRGVVGDAEGEGQEEVLDKPELRTVIKLDITVNNHTLVDQFEWDINCKRNNPEAFAEHMCYELNLSAEFKTAIAHQIREQVQIFAKSLLLTDHNFDGLPIDDEEVAAAFLPPLDSDTVLRSAKNKALFGPYYNPVSDFEIERMERDRERDTRCVGEYRR
ncbi:uncharacterized protein EV422DRAFT_501498, partial [Fimicolochytrium jonesii]|uniref:uncharacterized protein n=1 Tax=Fimicolochytrium jonesii TaxID=1396493 RepID=UPI0022FF0130